jgi:hypothetical protein
MQLHAICFFFSRKVALIEEYCLEEFAFKLFLTQHAINTMQKWDDI